MIRRIAIVVAALSLLATGCSATAAGNALSVSLDEWSVDSDPASFVAGQVTLDIDNDGEFPHTLVVEAVDGSVIAATDVIAPGGSARLDLVLDAAEYQFTCRIVTSLEDGTVVDHFAEGMIDTISPGD